MSEVVRVEAQAFAKGFKRMEAQIRATLPPDVDYDRFERVCIMAVQKNPKLLETDLRTLFLECQKAAADGLLPDGREAVLVPRWNKDLGREAATYQPMTQGLLKLARNSGEIASIHVEIAYKGEDFAVILGDQPHIHHVRNIDLVDVAPPIAVYAVAHLKNGDMQREVLTAKQVEAIRNSNKFWQKSPWAGPFVGEMWRKAALRRLYKKLPSSTDKEGRDRFSKAIERDAIDGEAADVTDQPAPPAAPASRDRPSRLDALEAQLAAQPPPAREVDPETGEVSAAAPDDGSAGLIAHIEACPSLAELDDLSKQPLFVEWRELNKQINPAGVRRVGAAFTKREQELAAKKNG